MNFSGDGRRLLCIGDYVDPAPEPVRMVAMPSCWFILRTHPLKEFKVSDKFEDNGVSFYLPSFVRLFARHARCGSAGSRISRRAALFPGLMFIPDFEVARLGWLKSFGGVAGLLHLGEHPARLTPELIGSVRAIEVDLRLPRGQRCPRYANGDQVRIIRGPFEGWKGRIGRFDGKGRIRVLIEAIKRESPVDVTEDQVEPAGLQPRWSDGSTG